MKINKSSEQGSVSAAVMAAVLSLSVASLYVSSNNQITKNRVDKAKLDNSAVTNESEALSNLSVFKSLLSPTTTKIGGVGLEAEPPIYALNYFADAGSWSIKDNSNVDTPIVTLSNNVKEKVGFVSLVGIPSRDLDIKTVASAFASDTSLSKTSASAPTQQIQIMSLQRDKSKPKYMRWMNVKTTVDFYNDVTKANEKKTTYAQIELPVPLPMAMKFELREFNDPANDWKEDFGSAADPMKAGRYSFRIMAKGLVNYGEITIGTQTYKVGLNDDNTPSHNANSVVNRSWTLIGQTPYIDFGQDVTTTHTTTTTGSAAEIERPQCDLILKNGTTFTTETETWTTPAVTEAINIRAQLIGVDEEPISIFLKKPTFWVAPKEAKEVYVNVGAPPVNGGNSNDSCSDSCNKYTTDFTPTGKKDPNVLGRPLTQAEINFNTNVDDEWVRYLKEIANKPLYASLPKKGTPGYDAGYPSSYEASDLVDREGLQNMRNAGFKGNVCYSYKDVVLDIMDHYNKPYANITGQERQNQWSNSLPKQQYAYYTGPSCERKTIGARDACGCFAEHTEIQMANGSLMPISELREGDMVWNPKTMKAHRVTEIVAGPELIPMLEIGTDGKSVLVTSEHPFLTQKGLKSAKTLEVGDVLMDGSRQSKVISITSKAPDMKNPPVAWNLVLEGDKLEDHYVNANGIMAGDLYLQRLLQNASKGVAAAAAAADAPNQN